MNKWLEIYNSIIRLKFYSYLKMQNSRIINDIDKEYQQFVNNNNLNPKDEAVEFFGGDFLIGLSYLILVRTNEFLNKESLKAEKYKVLDIENWKKLGIESFDKILSKYNIELITLLDTKNNRDYNYMNDNEKIAFFLTNIRHSLSHYNYNKTDLETIKFWNNHNNKLKMECKMKYSSFLNFSADFGIAVNIGLGKIYKK